MTRAGRIDSASYLSFLLKLGRTLVSSARSPSTATGGPNGERKPFPPGAQNVTALIG